MGEKPGFFSERADSSTAKKIRVSLRLKVDSEFTDLGVSDLSQVKLGDVLFIDVNAYVCVIKSQFVEADACGIS